MKLINDVKKLEKSDISKVIEKRLAEFSALGKKSNNEWFCELCFCLLTANSKAKTALSIQQELGVEGFLYKPQMSICEVIRRNKHRFHNNKSRFIVLARKYKKIKDILKKQENPRLWLVDNIKGLGFKESSHFLRNVGYTDYAILDRHILNIMKDNKMIKDKPKTLTKNNYLLIEDELDALAKKLKFNHAKLDLYLWYIKTGEVLK